MQQNERIYYLDWLRVSAFAILILFHSWQPFTSFQWLIKSENKSIIADILSVFFHTWRLYLIFFVSGMGTCIALKSKGQNFIYDRVVRLIFPFIFGAIVIIPCQYYYKALQYNPTIPFIEFLMNYPTFIINKNLKFDIFSWILEIGIHLWYLPSLFIMTLITLPLLKIINAKGISDKFLNRFTAIPKLILLFALPLLIILITLKPAFPDYTSVTDFLTYSIMFLYGFFFMSAHTRLLPVVQKNHIYFLILGILSSLFLIGCLLNETLRNAAFNPTYNIYHIIVSVPIGLSAFSWPLYFVSLFSRKFNFASKPLTELNKSILPVYIVHQSIIVVIGYYILNSISNDFIAFSLIVLGTFLGSSLFYLIISKFSLTRLFFGMKSK
jgi:glucans biosynthesis protein C